MQISVRVSAVVLILGAVSTALRAQPRPAIRVWSTRAIATVLAKVGAQFERTAGYRLDVSSDLSSGFAGRLAAGEPVDVVISASSSIDEWITQGRIVAETRTDLARSGIGVEVREGAAKPDISSVEALKRALLAAKSIAYLRVGSGIHIHNVIERLGISEAVRAKVTRPESDIVSELVARGEIELGIVVITQILTTPGVAFVGPLPAEVQSHIMFAAGVSVSSSAPEAAKQLVKFLSGTAAQAIMRRQGLEPVGAVDASGNRAHGPYAVSRILNRADLRLAAADEPVAEIESSPRSQPSLASGELRLGRPFGPTVPLRGIIARRLVSPRLR